MTATSRETVRDELVAFFQAEMAAGRLPVMTVIGSKADALEGEWPLIEILGRYSRRERVTFKGNKATFGFILTVWVRQSVEGSWTPAQAEDLLDEIEAAIATVFEDEVENRTIWEELDYDGDTLIVPALTSSGIPYYLEKIPVIARLIVN